MTNDELKTFCDELKKKRNQQQTEPGLPVSKEKPEAIQTPYEAKSIKKNQASVNRDFISFEITLGISGIYGLTLKEYLFGSIVIFSVLLAFVNPRRFKVSLKSKSFSRFMRILKVIIGVSIVLHIIARILKV